MLVTRRFTSPRYTMSANGHHTSTITCPTVSGYTPLAVIGFQNNHGAYVTPVAVYLTNNANTVSFSNKNWSGTTFTDMFDVVTVLYARNGLVSRSEDWTLP